MKELPIVRMNERHFDLGNGQKRVHIYGQPIYYKKNGKVLSVDSFSLFKHAGKIKNGSDAYPVEVTGTEYKVDGSVIKIIGLYVDDELLQAPNVATPVYSGNEIFYEEIFDGIDLTLIVTPYNTREVFTIKRNPLLGTGITGEKFLVKYQIDGDLKTKQPYAVDANGYLIKCFETDTEKGIAVKALYTYKYPIELDPSTSPIPSADAYVAWDEYDYYYGRADSATELRVQSNIVNVCGYNVNRYEVSYLRFDLASLAGVAINTATFNIYKASGTASTLLKGIGAAQEVNPETGSEPTIGNNGLGASTILTMNATTGAKTGYDVQSHVNTHKGGFCDFSLVSTGNTSANIFRPSEYATTNQRPYLVIDYGSSPTIVAVEQLVSVTARDTATLSQNHELSADELVSLASQDGTSVTQNQFISLAEQSAITSQDTAGITQTHIIGAVGQVSVAIQDDAEIEQEHVIVISEYVAITAQDESAISQDQRASPVGQASITIQDETSISQIHIISIVENTSTVEQDEVLISQSHLVELDGQASLTSQDAGSASQDSRITPVEQDSITVQGEVAIAQTHIINAEQESDSIQDDAEVTQTHLISVIGQGAVSTQETVSVFMTVLVYPAMILLTTGEKALHVEDILYEVVED